MLTAFYLSYGRILDRIQEKLQPNEQHQVHNIIAWLVSAKRPIKTLELLHALMILKGDRKLEHKRTLYKDMVYLCGPFIEEREGTITFVHFSAKELVCDIYAAKVPRANVYPEL